jgi:hypothetical protein
MACRLLAVRQIYGSRPSTRAQGEGQLGRCPFLIGSKFAKRREQAVAKTTTNLSVQDRVILFCVAMSIPHAEAAIPSRAMQSMAIRGYWAMSWMGMDAKTHNLALLAALSLFCAGVAWILGYLILGSILFALGGVAAVGIVREDRR